MESVTQFSSMAEVINAIHSGAYDHELDALVLHATNRQAAVARGSLNIGDAVEIIGQIRPKYMVGKVGVLERINRTTATVRFGNDVGRFANQEVRVPVSCLKRIQ